MADETDVLTTFKMDQTFELSIDADVIVGGMAGDHGKLAQLVREIDRVAEDWDLTLELCEYFASQKEAYDKEELEAASARGSDEP